MLIDFPNELLNKILEYLNYNAIKKCLLINSEIYCKVISIIPLMKNEEFTIEFIGNNIGKNNFDNLKLSRILIRNLKYNNWFQNLKLRYIPLFMLNKEFRHPIRIMPNQNLFSLIQRHPEKYLLSEPQLVYSGNIKSEKKGDSKELNCVINFSYHNSIFNKMLSYDSIIFDCRTSVIVNNRTILLNSSFRITKNNKDIFNIYIFGSRIYLYRHPLIRQIKFEINYNSKKKYKTKEILIPEDKKIIKKDKIIEIACHSMSLILDLEIENNITAGDILLNIMGDYMGEDKDIKNKFLFGNLREYYIPQGNYICI